MIMSDMTVETCSNHPERAAVESCEVCGTPLCAFCLYYASDGQRLCKAHADEAQAAGAFIRSPGMYYGGLIGSQVEANKAKIKKPSVLYEGNTADVVALIGVVFGVSALAMCFPPLCCLIGPVALVASIIGLTSARRAHRPRRTRALAGIGVAASVIWVTMLACGAYYLTQIASVSPVFGPIQVGVNARVTIAVGPFVPSLTYTPRTVFPRPYRSPTRRVATLEPTLRPGVSWHTVRRTDSLVDIAQIYHTTIRMLRDLNPELRFVLCDFTVTSGGPSCYLQPPLREGQRIRVPVATLTPSPTSSPVDTPLPTVTRTPNITPTASTF
jgi:hypothetical protein